MMNHRIIPEKMGCDKESFEQLLEKAVDAFNDTEGDAVERVVAAARVVRPGRGRRRERVAKRRLRRASPHALY